MAQYAIKSYCVSALSDPPPPTAKVGVEVWRCKRGACSGLRPAQEAVTASLGTRWGWPPPLAGYLATKVVVCASMLSVNGVVAREDCMQAMRAQDSRQTAQISNRPRANRTDQMGYTWSQVSIQPP